MNMKEYFSNPSTSFQKHYEALRAFYYDKLPAKEAAKKFNFSPRYFEKLRIEFSRKLREEKNPFFSHKKTGPKGRSTSVQTIERVVALRKKNHSIIDIKQVLDVEGQALSLYTIDSILKSEGFAPLPKRTRQERSTTLVPDKIKAPQSSSMDWVNEKFITGIGAGPLVFLPLIEKLGIVKAIKSANFPSTSKLSDVQMVLSFLALKLMGSKRLSHDTNWNLDRAMGLFAGLNVLPKSATLSTYSYRVNRKSNKKFLTELSQIFHDPGDDDGVFNLDFKAIPHWGDDSVLENNWSGSKCKAIKSILALIVQSPSTGFINYTDAEIKHENQNDAVIEFVDFWQQNSSKEIKMLIFDSKFTTYENLNKLNRSDKNIKFLTLRRRGKNLIKQVEAMPKDEWTRVQIERTKSKKAIIKVHDGKCKLRKYEGEVRQIILTDHGHLKPTFLVTNDFDSDVKTLVKKYARRCLVEQEIAEQMAFFHLNSPSSSIIVKVDFDLTMTLLAHNLYRYIAKNLPGFEECTVESIHRKFIENGANVNIKNNKIDVHLRKKTHLPILFDLPWMKESTKISWLNNNEINFSAATTS